MTAPYLDHSIAKDVFGGPRGILAWGPELPGAGKCVATKDGYRATGQWGFATGSRHATWLGAHCPVFEEDGSPRIGANGRQVTRTMLVPKKDDGHRQLVTGSDSYKLEKPPAWAYTAMRDNAEERREPSPLYSVHQRHDLRDELFARVAGDRLGAYDLFIETRATRSREGRS